MTPNWEVIDHAIEVLNRALAADPDTVRALFAHRVVCNETLTDDPTIQVTVKNMPTLGVLGLVNGLFGVAPSGYGFITAEYDDEDTPGGYAKEIVRFRRTDTKLLGAK